MIVKNALKKSENIRFTLSRTGEALDTSRVSGSEISSSKNHLLVMGSNCGHDLIKLNRRKLEDLISKIEGNNYRQLSSKPTPEMVIKRCKDLTQKMEKRDDNLCKTTPNFRA